MTTQSVGKCVLCGIEVDSSITKRMVLCKPDYNRLKKIEPSDPTKEIKINFQSNKYNHFREVWEQFHGHQATPTKEQPQKAPMEERLVPNTAKPTQSKLESPPLRFKCQWTRYNVGLKVVQEEPVIECDSKYELQQKIEWIKALRERIAIEGPSNSAEVDYELTKSWDLQNIGDGEAMNLVVYLRSIPDADFRSEYESLKAEWSA